MNKAQAHLSRKREGVTAKISASINDSVSGLYEILKCLQKMWFPLATGADVASLRIGHARGVAIKPGRLVADRE